MSDGQVLAFLGSMRLAKLNKAGVYTVYSVPPGGYIKMRHEKLRESAPVFASATGQPLMLVKCGNPLTRGPNNPVAVTEISEASGATEMRETAVAADTPASEDLVAMAPGVPAVPAEPISIAETPVTILPGAFGFSPWPLGFLIIPFLDNDDDNGTTVIPEPTTFAVFGVGLAWFARRKRLRR